MRLIRNHRNEKQSKPFSYMQQTVKAAVVAVAALDWQCRSKVFSCLTSPAKYKEHSLLLFHNNSDLRAENVSYRKEAMLPVSPWKATIHCRNTSRFRPEQCCGAEIARSSCRRA